MGCYQVYIKGFAELAAPLMNALKGKYQYEPKDPNEPKTATGVAKNVRRSSYRQKNLVSARRMKRSRTLSF